MCDASLSRRRREAVLECCSMQGASCTQLCAGQRELAGSMRGTSLANTPRAVPIAARTSLLWQFGQGHPSCEALESRVPYPVLRCALGPETSRRELSQGVFAAPRPASTLGCEELRRLAKGCPAPS